MTAMPKAARKPAIDFWPIDELVPYARNSRKHSPEQVAQLVGAVREFGWTMPVLVEPDGGIIAGHGRVMAAQELYKTGGLIRLADGTVIPEGTVPVLIARDWPKEKVRAYVIADNKLALNAEWDEEMLRLELGELRSGFDIDLGTIGFSDADLKLIFPDPVQPGADNAAQAGRLSERFGIPPFSVLNAREGWWQDRKRAWMALGIQSELGRGDVLFATEAQARLVEIQREGKVKKGLAFGEMKSFDGAERTMQGTSIFDPVVCELAYRWFSPPGGTVLDPFAGGSVRGIVASKLGRRYVGVDLRAEQVAANRVQAERICGDPAPQWIVGDSREIGALAEGVQADFVFSCPPYADLEVYSDDPRDLSTLGYAEFRDAYYDIIAEACSLLKPNRFACFVVGEVRDKDGSYYGFVSDTIAAFRAAGLEFYNEGILVTAVGSLPIRAGKQFAASRKFGKTHQNILVFVKGDAKLATAEMGEVEFGEIDEADEEAGEEPAAPFA